MNTLKEQAEAGTFAQAALADAFDMMTRLAHWDMLTHEEMAVEFGKGTASRFYGIPGFEPRWCHDCHCEQFFDYREDPEGACMVCGAWDGQDMKGMAA